ncbi:hypothetical protein ACFPL7_02180 [Dongia soli]|uniref:Uncharacterized protein n=1 Tax=Dongia soli TaxID=600628 RepID=A0ABU5EFT2_9PROT|nr:hypothetical protein [Dongia soli]MDY0885265.1 hypothetical protein [Dongia soli]
MPLQNRVTPFGDIVAIPQRGMFTGNRGIIHDPTTRTLISRRWTSKAWLVCSCDYKNVRRDVMATRSWTELFFLDEATAFAAGHRPCFACRRSDALRFRSAWALGNHTASAKVSVIDRILHAERLDKSRKRLHPLTDNPMTLPNGMMLASGRAAYLVASGQFFLWCPEGYRPIARPHHFDGILTPPSTMRAMAAGYLPILHPSVLSTP